MVSLNAFGMKVKQKKKEVESGHILFQRFMQKIKENKQKLKDHKKINKNIINAVSDNMFSFCIYGAKDGKEWVSKEIEKVPLTSWIASYLSNYIDESIEVAKKNEEKIKEGVVKTLEDMIKKHNDTSTDQLKDHTSFDLSEKLTKFTPEQAKKTISFCLYLVENNPTSAKELFDIISPKLSYWLGKAIVNQVIKNKVRFEKKAGEAFNKTVNLGLDKKK